VLDDIPHTASSTANLCMWHESACFFQTHVDTVVSDPDSDAEITSMQRENFHRKTIHEMRI
jgi:hypothetical protein